MAALIERFVTLAALAALAAGCTQRAAPYRFRGPVVSGVQAGELPPPGDDSLPDAESAPAPRPVVVASRRTAAARVVHADRGPSTSPVRETSTRGGPLADTLRGMVGARDRNGTALSFALSALATIGADLDERVRDVADGEALVALAESRGATSTNGEALLGDLVVFDDVVDRAPASAIGVVVAVAGDGTLEFVYLARGVVRRGYVNLARAHEKRDDEGRALNTIIRQKQGNGKRGRGDLAGQRFRTFIHLDGLSAR